jgi:hypothetical protein
LLIHFLDLSNLALFELEYSSADAALTGIRLKPAAGCLAFHSPLELVLEDFL